MIGHGRRPTVKGERPQFWEAIGEYACPVTLADGSEALVVSRSCLGPWRIHAPFVLRPVAEVRGG